MSSNFNLFQYILKNCICQQPNSPWYEVWKKKNKRCRCQSETNFQLEQKFKDNPVKALKELGAKSVAALNYLITLKIFFGNAHPAHSTIARKIKSERTSVTKMIGRVSKTGLINKHRNFDTSCDYYINPWLFLPEVRQALGPLLLSLCLFQTTPMESMSDNGSASIQKPNATSSIYEYSTNSLTRAFEQFLRDFSVIPETKRDYGLLYRHSIDDDVRYFKSLESGSGINAINWDEIWGSKLAVPLPNSNGYGDDYA